MPIPEEFKLILIRLEKATKEGRANWFESAKPNLFSIAFSGFTLQLGFWRPEQDHDFIDLSLLDSNGATVTSFSVEAVEPEFNRLRDLWGQALRKARRVDETLKKLADELDADGPVGDKPMPF